MKNCRSNYYTKTKTLQENVPVTTNIYDENISRKFTWSLQRNYEEYNFRRKRHVNLRRTDFVVNSI